MYKEIKLHLIIISMIYVLLFFMSSILDQKLVNIGFFSVPAPFLYFTFIYPLSNAVAEIYGPKNTWKFLLSGYFITVVFALGTLGIIHLPNPVGANYTQIQKDYEILDSAILGCLGWGYLAFFVGMFINVKLMAKFKLKFSGAHYYRRSIISCLFSELIVTILANLLIWGPRLTYKELIKLIFFGYLFLIPVTIIWAYIGNVFKNILYICEGNKKYIFNEDFWRVLK